MRNKEERERINRAVMQAEAKTAAEIVPVLAASSGLYERAEDLAGLWFGLASMALIGAAYPVPAPESGSFADGPWVAHLAALMAAMTAGFLAGLALATRSFTLRRLFTSPSRMEETVTRSAQATFFDQRIRHTERLSGILIYVSLYERMAAILVDVTVQETLGQEFVDAMCAELTSRLHGGDPVQAMVDVIGLLGDQLAEILPPDPEDVNELSDSLVELD